MKTIEVDNEIYDFIGKNAEPFVDTPNSVLRKLLLNNVVVRKTSKSGQKPFSIPKAEISRDVAASDFFVHKVLATKFLGEFSLRGRYRMMFESAKEIVYFQNFNKEGTNNLWFRLNKKPLDIMRESNKIAYICLTNPAEGYGFKIPLAEIDKKIFETSWSREELEVNIDPTDSRWREMSWGLKKFLFTA